MFFPERKHRPHSGHIDWQVVALDGLGLMLLFVPGVIAFAVDFYTGAIYLPFDRVPSGRVATNRSQRRSTEVNRGSTRFHRISTDNDCIDLATIEQTVSHCVGYPVRLDDQQTRVSRLESIDHFNDQLAAHQQNATWGQPIQSLKAAATG
jgi:hypothetical protein